MEKSLVTVIVPIYNNEIYLRQCIESILSQTYKELEVLLIDDGSTDNSLSICYDYSKRDKRIRVFHQENKGVSAARNLGIDNAVGDYISFIDSDDYISAMMIDEMARSIKENNIAICGYNRVKEKIKTMAVDKESLTREELFCHTFCSYLVSSSCWNKLFRKEIIEENRIRFNIEIILAEDIFFLAQYYKKCENIGCVTIPLYQYRCNPNSTIQNTHINKTFNNKKITYLDTMEKVENLYCDDSIYIRKCISFRKVRGALYLMFQMITCEDYNSQLGKRIKEVAKKNGKCYRSFCYSSRLECLTTLGLTVSPFLIYKVGVIWNHICKETFNKYLF